MAQGIKALRRVQIGVETTPGTAVTPTAVWRGSGVMKDERKINFVEEDLGLLSGSDRTVTPYQGASISIQGDSTYEQLPYILGAGIAKATPTTDTGSGYIYSYAFPTSDAISDTDLGTVTIIAGDNASPEKAAYGYCESFEIAGTAGEAVTVSADFKLRQPSTDSYASISPTTVESMLASKAALYIDTTSDTAGTTQVSQTLLSFTLTNKTGWTGVLTADGRLDYSFCKQTMPEVLLKVVFEHNSSSIAEKEKWRSETARLIQLKILGTALTSAGTYTYKTFIANLWGKWESFDAIADKDGNDTIAGTFRCRYNAAGDGFVQYKVINELVSLP